MRKIASLLATAFALLSASLLANPSPVFAETHLAHPLVCPEACRVVKLFDRDRRVGRILDHRGGQLASDQHLGVDYAVASLAVGRSTPVVAMAPGRVVAVRDGMADVDVRSIPRTLRWTLVGREGGNLVLVDHGSGLSTLYAHLARNSVAVRTGERVETGQILGFVGMSGRAAFPHLEVQVRRNGKPVDPVVFGVSG